MGEFANELVLLMLPTDKWRQIGYAKDGSRSTICGALLAEEWVNGGPAPSEDDFVHAIRKETSQALEQVVDPLVAEGRLAADQPRKKLLGLIPMGNLPYFKVMDVAARDAVFHRMETSLGGTDPPSFATRRSARSSWRASTGTRPAWTAPSRGRASTPGASRQPGDR